MKKTLAIALTGMSLALAASGQGVNFLNSSTTQVRLTDGTTLATLTGGTSGSSFFADLLWSPLGANNFVLTRDTSGNTAPPAIVATSSPGRFAGGERRTTVADTRVDMQVVVWDSFYGATLSAFASNPAAGTAGALYGVSSVFQVTTAAGGLPANSIVSVLAPGLSTFSGNIILTPVPEPSVVALGVLGALVLLFRRRK